MEDAPQLISVGAGDDRLARFYASLYLDAFAAQREPLEAWQRALRGDAPYELGVVLAITGDDIAGGIAYELYPRSRCGLVTYMVVAPPYRRAGLGKRMQDEAIADLAARGARAVFGEVDDPARRAGEAAEVARRRLERNLRWGATVLDVRYVQPALGPGLARDDGLLLLSLRSGPVAPDVIEAFVRELYAATEGT
jgi:GNAT superfamily N-acetyltransferase